MIFLRSSVCRLVVSFFGITHYHHKLQADRVDYLAGSNLITAVPELCVTTRYSAPLFSSLRTSHQVSSLDFPHSTVFILSDLIPWASVDALVLETDILQLIPANRRRKN